MSPAETFMDQISRLAAEYEKAFREIAAKHKLTGPQLQILDKILTVGPQSSAYLAKNLYATPANITCIVDNLEKMGLIIRKPLKDDRRTRLIYITPEGRNLTSVLHLEILGVVVEGMKNVTAVELIVTNNMLDRVQYKYKWGQHEKVS